MNKTQINVSFLLFLLIHVAYSTRLKSKSINPVEKSGKFYILLQNNTMEFNNTNNTKFNIQIKNNTNSLKREKEREIIQDAASIVNLKFNFLEENNQKLAFTTNLDNQKNYFAILEACSIKNCNSPYGSCLNNTICLCNSDYGHLPNSQSENSCSNKLKQQSVFFIVEFFTCSGLGHIYAQRLLFGLLKFSFVSFTVFFHYMIKNLFDFKFYPKSQLIFKAFIYLLYSIVCFFQLYDVIMIGIGNYKDGNGLNLKRWELFY